MGERAKRKPLTKKEKVEKEIWRKENNLPIGAGNRGPGPRYDQAYADKLADDLDAWSRLERSRYVSAFMAEHEDPLTWEVFADLEKRSKKFEEKLHKVRTRLAMKLRDAATDKKIDGSFYRMIMPLVDKEYKEWRIQELGLEAANAHAQALMVTINPEKGLVQTVDVKPELQAKNEQHRAIEGKG